ncbi:MAG: phosphonoacetaldehyde reductase [Planctomycetales bacterium]|nr:phosphonoacetaldehyde reductase [Planctomycetales bacterium]
MPQPQIQYGRCESVGEVLAAWQAQRLFCVMDRTAMEASGARELLSNSWASRHVDDFDRFQVNPRLEDALLGLEKFRASGCDALLAVGGGTAMDLAKVIRCLAAQRSPLQHILQGSCCIAASPIPLIAIPTTAGTGSEATHFAVLYADGVKHSLADHSLLPEVAVLDWRLTQSLPPRITAETGLDAMCQAIESLWCVNSTAQSMAYAEEALRWILPHLPAAVHRGDPVARQAMCRAAHLAGQAINLTKTTAPHAVSYTMTHDFGVPHGHAVALTLGAFLQFNAEVTSDDCNDPRGVEHVRDTIARIGSHFGSHSPPQTRALLDRFLGELGCETSLSRLGIDTRSKRQQIACGVNLERLRNNPRQITPQQLDELLQALP